MRRVMVLITLPLLVACEQEPQLTLAQQVKMIATECHELAAQQSGFDPRTAQEPPRTISTTTRRGGEVLGSGAVARGAAGGAALGAVGGAIADDAGTGAGIGAAVGGLLGGIRRHRETNEPVTRTFANPDYEEFVAAQRTFKATFDGCMAERAGATE
jgi:hypothetical protein